MTLSPFWKNMVTKGVIRVIGQILVELSFMILLLIGTAYLFITWIITVSQGCPDGPPVIHTPAMIFLPYGLCALMNTYHKHMWRRNLFRLKKRNFRL